MRKIEQAMNKAIAQGIDWSLDNTKVQHTAAGAEVYLYGHHIATINVAQDTKKANVSTFKEWPTATTKSRLRALGINYKEL